jgi:hypothetical protein
MVKRYKTTPEHMDVLISSGQIMHRANWVEHGPNIVEQMLLELKPPNLITLGKTQRKKRIGNLSMMVKNVMREFNVPLSRHHWAQKWCCDVHNIAANRKLDWKSAKERKTGYTPDISMFLFHLWEPYTKQPENSLKKARWLGIAHSTGDAMTYFIETERDETSKRNVILVWSIIKTRRKNIGTATEFVNDDPALADFFLARPELKD